MMPILILDCRNISIINETIIGFEQKIKDKGWGTRPSTCGCSRPADGE
jgi:hypothetical protein